MKDGGERKLLIVTSEDVAEQVVLSMQENNYARFSLAGVAVINADWTGREIHGVPVVANEETAAMYVRNGLTKFWLLFQKFFRIRQS